MNFFGFNFGGPRELPTPLVTPETGLTVVKREQAPTIRPELSISIPENKKPANIAPIRPTVMNYAATTSRRGQWATSDYDLPLINRIEDTDSYVAQAFIKKTGLMFKEGYEFVGPDPKTIQYIKLRFAQISRATGMPIDELLRSLGASLIKKSNAFLVKARKESASGGRVRTVAGGTRELEPVAGYFIVPAELMSFEADQMGRVVRWKLCLPDGREQFFKLDDVVHMYFNRKEGFVYGTPTIVPVVDDIRSLRKIEENIELLVYQHLFPLFHYKIGSDDFPAGLDELGNDEIEVAKMEVRQMPSEGGLVTSHRHEISLIGAENRSLRAEGYLEHFKKRVFSGLGISAVDMGEGECYSSDTQTLTENGWKFHWQIDHKTERIATFNPDTNKIEFHFANYKYEGKYQGDMIRFSNGEELDVLVTPHHDMWVQHYPNRIAWGKVHAVDLFNLDRLNANMLLSTAFSENTTVDEIPEDLIVSWSVLAGHILSGGVLNTTFDEITITNTRHFNEIHPLELALNDLNIPFIKTKVTSAGHRHLEFKFSSKVYSGALTRYLKTNGYEVVNEVLRLPIPARKILADALLDSGAGKKGKKFIRGCGKADHYWYVHADTDFLDVVQTILLSCGYSAVLKKGQIKGNPVNYVNIRTYIKHKHIIKLHKDFLTVEKYSGDIYCYNVPNHLFLTRRNGRVCINGNTANRATSDNMSRNLVDSVKDIQRVIESQFTEFVINELLLESTFGSDVLNEEHRVYLKFKEIDLDYQIKKEEHYAEQFTKNIISHHEARTRAGLQPMRLPTAEEIDGDPNIAEKYPEWYGTNWKLIEEPKALIQAIDEPYSAGAIAAAANKNTDINSSTMEEAGEKQMEHEVELEKEKGKAKVAIAKLKPKPVARKDSFLTPRYEALESDTINMITTQNYSDTWLNQIAFMTESEMIRELRGRVMSSFAAGYRSVNPRSDQQIDANMRVRSKLEARVNFYVTRLIRQTVQAVKRQNIDTLEKDVRIQKVKAAFSALQYRNDFIEDVEIRKAFNLGVLQAALDLGHNKWTLDVPTDACMGCRMAAGKEMTISDSLDLEDVPPLHANSRSKIKLI